MLELLFLWVEFLLSRPFRFLVPIDCFKSPALHVLTKENTELTKVNTVLTKKNTVLTKVNSEFLEDVKVLVEASHVWAVKEEL